jgi:hypothetical protein
MVRNTLNQMIEEEYVMEMIATIGRITSQVATPFAILTNLFM